MPATGGRARGFRAAIATVVVGGVIAIESCGDHGGLRSVGADSAAGQGGSAMGFGGQQGEDGAASGGVVGTSSGNTGSGGGTGMTSRTGGASGGSAGAVTNTGSSGAARDGGGKVASLDITRTCGHDERGRLYDAIRRGVGPLYPRYPQLDTCYMDPNFGRDGTVVFNDQGQLVDTTIKYFDPYPSAKQVWLDSLMNERWPCLAGYTVWVRCYSKLAGL